MNGLVPQWSYWEVKKTKQQKLPDINPTKNNNNPNKHQLSNDQTVATAKQPQQRHIQPCSLGANKLYLNAPTSHCGTFPCKQEDKNITILYCGISQLIFRLLLTRGQRLWLLEPLNENVVAWNLFLRLRSAQISIVRCSSSSHKNSGSDEKFDAGWRSNRKWHASGWFNGWSRHRAAVENGLKRVPWYRMLLCVGNSR